MGIFFATAPALRALLCLAWPTLGAVAVESVRTHRLEAGALAVTIVTGKENAHPRFDETSVVTEVVFEGRSHLTGAGLVDEFGLEGLGVLGYDDAAKGETFIKIGVGVLERDCEDRYRFQHAYPRRASFAVDVFADESEVRATQMSDDIRGYRYAYEKRYSLTSPACFTISYVLSNRGSRPFSFEHYNHNFFHLPVASGGRGARINTAFPLHSPADGWRLTSETSAQWVGDEMLDTGKFWRMPLRPPVDAAIHSLTLGLGEGRSVRLVGDSPVVRLAVWLEKGAICPELFSRFVVQPGETVTWSRAYHFDETGGHAK